MKTKKRLRALTGAITDIVLAAVILLVFAYFHHGRMYLLGRGFVEAPAATVQPTAAAAAHPTSIWYAACRRNTVWMASWRTWQRNAFQKKTAICFARIWRKTLCTKNWNIPENLIFPVK